MTIISRHSQQVLMDHGLSIRTPIRTGKNSVSVGPKPNSDEPVDFVVDCRQGGLYSSDVESIPLKGVVVLNGAEAGKVWRVSG